MYYHWIILVITDPGHFAVQDPSIKKWFQSHSQIRSQTHLCVICHINIKIRGNVLCWMKRSSDKIFNFNSLSTWIYFVLTILILLILVQRWRGTISGDYNTGGKFPWGILPRGYSPCASFLGRNFLVTLILTQPT